MDSAKVVLELQDVTKTYHMEDVEVQAVKGISLRVMENDFIAIMGASGSGKSTTLSIIGALDRPTSGRVILDGTDITALPDSQIARIRGLKLGFMFQAFNLHPTLTVYENVALPMRIHEFSESEIAEKVPSLLHRVGLTGRARHLPSQLSGGERQRVALARALSTSPPVLLADEPTGNLDSRSGAEIVGLIKELNRNEGMAIILVTHEASIARQAKKILTVSDGMIISEKRVVQNAH